MENIEKIIFHLAIPIGDVTIAKKFYHELLEAKVGRENDSAVIFDFFGHQIVGHVSKEELIPQKGIYPRHFGIVFTKESDWDSFLNSCLSKGISFYQEARIRFTGKITEHKTFFLQDPFYNILEFKFYRHYEAIFGASNFTQVGDRYSY